MQHYTHLFTSRRSMEIIMPLLLTGTTSSVMMYDDGWVTCSCEVFQYHCVLPNAVVWLVTSVYSCAKKCYLKNGNKIFVQILRVWCVKTFKVSSPLWSELLVSLTKIVFWGLFSEEETSTRQQTQFVLDQQQVKTLVCPWEQWESI